MHLKKILQLFVISITFISIFFSDTDPYGFVREDDFDYKSYEEFESEYLSILTRRSMRWKKVMTKEKFRHDRRSMIFKFNYLLL